MLTSTIPLDPVIGGLPGMLVKLTEPRKKGPRGIAERASSGEIAGLGTET
jgi:hypothetical protein